MSAELVRTPVGHYLLRSDTAGFQFRGGAMKSFQYKDVILIISFIVLSVCMRMASYKLKFFPTLKSGSQFSVVGE